MELINEQEQTKKVFNPMKMNAWFERMKQLMLSNPQRMEEVEQKRKAEENHQLYVRYLHCGAPEQALREAGWKNYRVYNNNPTQNGLFGIFQQYADVLKGSAESISFSSVCTRKGNLFINGKAGTGKTFMALSLIRQLCGTKKESRNYIKWNVETQTYEELPLYVDEYFDCAYVKSSQLVMELTTKDYNGSGRRAACWNTYSNADFLVIDNAFGDGGYKEKDELKILYQIFDARMERGLPTMLISGFTETEDVNWDKLLGAGFMNKIRMNSLLLRTDDIEDMRQPTIQNWLKSVS